MRGRMLLAKWGILVGSGVASAQFPQRPEAPPYQPAIPLPLSPANPGSPQAPGAQPPGAQAPGQLPLSPQPPNPLPPLQPAMPAIPTQPPLPGRPALPGTSGGLTPPGSPGFPANPGTQLAPIAQPQEIKLPQPENKFALNASDVTLKRLAGGWQLWAGQKMLRDFGDREMDARDAYRVYKDLRSTEWVTIGSGKPIVEYALVNGRPPATLGGPVAPGAEDPRNPMGTAGPKLGAAGAPSFGPAGGFSTGPAVTGAGAKIVVPIDLRTVRVEAVRGVWCLRDDNNIHFNFGSVKTDAEQALAVVQRYGFNRIGVVGAPTPAMTYFFVSQDDGKQFDRGPFAKAALQAQIDGLDRVGIPVPGVGFVGEMVRIDPRKLDVRKNGTEWVVASGTEIIGRYGPGEWTAHDAARTLSDARFTELCRVGSSNLTFFLVDGKAPNRVPLNAQGRRFDPGALKVRQLGERWAVTENGRHLFDCATAEEGEILIRVVKHFGFDQLCHLGPSPKLGVSFLAKGQ
jgi:hypothetical protein